MRDELPFEYEDGSYLPNSELTLKSWFIENPLTRDLEKSITYKMPAETEKEFIIVMKAPMDKPLYNLAAFLVISLVDQARKRAHHLVKHLKPGSGDLEDIEIETQPATNQEV